MYIDYTFWNLENSLWAYSSITSFCLAFPRYLISFPTHSHSFYYYCIMKLPWLSKRPTQIGSPLKRMPEHYLFIKQICAASVFPAGQHLDLAAWIYGSSFRLDNRTKHLKILLVDLDAMRSVSVAPDDFVLLDFIVSLIPCSEGWFHKGPLPSLDQKVWLPSLFRRTLRSMISNLCMMRYSGDCSTS